MNVFLTGGTGYIGSTLISRLADEDKIQNIMVLARRREGVSQLNKAIGSSENLKVTYGDVRSHNYDLRNVGAVIHLANVHNPYWCEQNSVEAISINVQGTQRLLNAVREFEVPYFVFISTQSVYPKQYDVLFNEDDKTAPAGVYPITKYICEEMIKTLVDSSTKFAILRPSKVYGLGAFVEWDSLTAKFARFTCIGKGLTIYGDGNQGVDFVHVRDVSDFICGLLTASGGTWNEIYNVSGGRFVTINVFVEIYIEVAGEMGLKAPGKSYVNKGIDEEYIYRRLDISKARRKLGWAPRWSIEEGVRELIKAYLDYN